MLAFNTQFVRVRRQS